MMNDYDTILEELVQRPVGQNWHQFRDIASRFAQQKPQAWLLPLQACRAVGGKREDGLPAATAIAGLQISLVLIDDLLDNELDGRYGQVGDGAAANLASAFQTAATQIVVTSHLPPQIKLAILDCLNQMLTTVAYGQHLDTQNPADEAGYWQVVQAKSAIFFNTAMRIGALAGGAAPETVARLEQLGGLYGEMIQIHDDLNDSLAQPAGSDWLLGRSSLPLLFARTVNHPWQVEFNQLCGTISDPAALAAAQTILIRCGALSYCVACLLERHQKVQTILNKVRLPHPQEIAGLLAHLIAPVQRLRRSLNVSPAFAVTATINGSNGTPATCLDTAL
jgi:geranylgeranyl pyrophosphate synthase